MQGRGGSPCDRYSGAAIAPAAWPAPETCSMGRKFSYSHAKVAGLATIR